MNIKLFMITIIFLASLFSCNSNKEKRSAETMKYFSYSEQGMLMYGESYSVKRKNDSAEIEITYYNPPYTLTTDTSIFNDLQAIIDKYKIQKFKKNYQPILLVSDGISWSLNIEYENSDLSIYSSGNNAWPKNAGTAFDEIQNYFRNRFVKEEEK